MIPFEVRFESGKPVYEQAVYAAKRAIVSGVMRPGDEFPSVRKLSQELRINPNTAHKVVAALTAEGLLAVKPGVGTVIAETPEQNPKAKRRLLDHEVERLMVEARKLNMDVEDVVDAVRTHWGKLKERS